MTQSMSFVRSSYHDENASLKPQVRFNQWLLFDDARLCELQREALLLFEIYANFIDDTELSASSEVLDGAPMSLIGWCSQALFDHDHRLITGERHLGIFNPSIIPPTGFYSLRNVFEHNCPILGISFLDQSYVWPDVQPRNDLRAGNFMEISRDKQEYLSRLLKRPSLLLNDHVKISNKDRRKYQVSHNQSDDGNRIMNEEKDRIDEKLCFCSI